MRLYAGLDRSGTPDLRDSIIRNDPYVVCIAAIEAPEEWRTHLVDMRARLGMRADAEFHGHEVRETKRIAFLKLAQEFGLRIGATLIDKIGTRDSYEWTELASPNEMLWRSSLELLERFFNVYPLVGLWCDEDIRDKRSQRKFSSRVKALHRSAWPGRTLIVRHKSSETSDLIQLADVVAYSLARYNRDPSSEPALGQILKAIIKDSGNSVVGPVIWTR